MSQVAEAALEMGVALQEETQAHQHDIALLKEKCLFLVKLNVNVILNLEDWRRGWRIP